MVSFKTLESKVSVTAKWKLDPKTQTDSRSKIELYFIKTKEKLFRQQTQVLIQKTTTMLDR